MRENLLRARFLWCSGVFLIGVLSMTASGQTLIQIAKFDLPGPIGKRFDYLTVDNDDHYLLSAHLAVEVVCHPRRVEVRAGQAGGEFHQLEGRRRRLPAEGGGRAPLRRRCRRDGVRRSGPPTPWSARSGSASGRTAAHDRGGVRSGGHHLRSQHPRDCHRARGTQRLRDQLHRGHADHQGHLSRREDQRRREQPVVRLPRQRRGCRKPFTPCSCTTRSRPASTWGS